MSTSLMKLHVDVISNGDTIAGVPCTVRLPRLFTESVRIFLTPTIEQYASLISGFEFSMHGDLFNVAGDKCGAIVVDRAHVLRSERKSRLDGFQEYRIDVSPTFTEVQWFHDFTAAHSTESQSSIQFWLTPCHILTPLTFRELSDSKGMCVRHATPPQEVLLASGATVSFNNHLSYISQGNRETRIIDQLVGLCQRTSDLKICTRDILSELEDFLALVSFATGQQVVCMGWEEWLPDRIIQHYDHNHRVPRNLDGSYFGILADHERGDAILPALYAAFSNSTKQNLLRQAIYAATMSGEHQLEGAFRQLFFSLEAVLGCAGPAKGKGRLLNDRNWKGLRKRLVECIESTLPDPGQAEVRHSIIEKLPDLNRPPLRVSYESFCKCHGLELGDLWPLCESSQGISLAGIRNLLTHGFVVTDDAAWLALMHAEDHLRWTAQLMILAYLGWPRNSTARRPEDLQRYNSYSQWQQHQATLTLHLRPS